MINGTIKDYTITTLQNILGMLVIQKGTQTKAFKTLNGMTLYTHELYSVDIHTSNGLYIKSLKTNWHYKYIQPKRKIPLNIRVQREFINNTKIRREPYNTMVTYFTNVHPDDIHKDIRNLTKQTLWEIILILSE